MNLVEGQAILAQLDTLRERVARFVGARGGVGFTDAEANTIIAELRTAGDWTNAVDATLARMIKAGKPRGEAVATLTAGNAKLAAILEKMKVAPASSAVAVAAIHTQPKK